MELICQTTLATAQDSMPCGILQPAAAAWHLSSQSALSQCRGKTSPLAKGLGEAGPVMGHATCRTNAVTRSHVHVYCRAQLAQQLPVSGGAVSVLSWARTSSLWDSYSQEEYLRGRTHPVLQPPVKRRGALPPRPLSTPLPGGHAILGHMLTPKQAGEGGRCDP